MNLEQQHKARFREDGILSFRRLIPKSVTVRAREHLLCEMERLGIRKGGKWHVRQFDGISPFLVAGRIGQKIKPHADLDQVVSMELLDFVSALAGFALKPAQAHPQVLLTPPQRAEWSIPELGWHVDITAPSQGEIPGIQIFVLVDDVAPRGGGTMAIAGSHRMPDLAPTPDRVVEMCGSAGDVYLMDMRVRHAPSINASANARMMLTWRFVNPKFLG